MTDKIDIAAAIAERDNRMESLEQGMVDLAISPNKIAEHQVSELLSEIERLTARAEAAEAMADRLADAVIGAQNIVLHCEIADGSCCCGEEMARHSNPIDCGHQPIDHGQYYADKWLEGSADLIAAHAAMKEGR